MARFQDQTLEEILVMLGELTPSNRPAPIGRLSPRTSRFGRKKAERKAAKKASARSPTGGLRLLRRRLGTLSKAQQVRVQALPVDQLEDLIEALLDFSAAADLETWLAAHPYRNPRV